MPTAQPTIMGILELDFESFGSVGEGLSFEAPSVGWTTVVTTSVDTPAEPEETSVRRLVRGDVGVAEADCPDAEVASEDGLSEGLSEDGEDAGAEDGLLESP